MAEFAARSVFAPAMIFDRCQQFGCRSSAETWCPLCRAFFCKQHDELYPARRHDCLRGPAETRDG